MYLISTDAVRFMSSVELVPPKLATLPPRVAALMDECIPSRFLPTIQLGGPRFSPGG